MKCQILFSWKKKNISKCRLLKILPRLLSVKGNEYYFRGGYSDKVVFCSLVTDVYSKRTANRKSQKLCPL